MFETIAIIALIVVIAIVGVVVITFAAALIGGLIDIRVWEAYSKAIDWTIDRVIR